jgi:3-hydroxyisobutyrate dehydrogenase-like beta-hydroxyacid dehydrogenase
MESRNPDQGEPLVKLGAEAAPDIASTVEGAGVVAYCLSDEIGIEEVVLGEGGVLSCVKRGQVVFDHSTVHPQTSRKQAEVYAGAGK